MTMTKSEKHLFEARKERFKAKTRSDSFANQLCGAGVTNDGPKHDSAKMIARSKRAGIRIIENIFNASLDIGRR